MQPVNSLFQPLITLLPLTNSTSNYYISATCPTLSSALKTQTPALNASTPLGDGGGPTRWSKGGWENWDRKGSRAFRMERQLDKAVREKLTGKKEAIWAKFEGNTAASTGALSRRRVSGRWEQQVQRLRTWECGPLKNSKEATWLERSQYIRLQEADDRRQMTGDPVGHCRDFGFGSDVKSHWTLFSRQVRWYAMIYYCYILFPRGFMIKDKIFFLSALLAVNFFSSINEEYELDINYLMFSLLFLPHPHLVCRCRDHDYY